MKYILDKELNLEQVSKQIKAKEEEYVLTSHVFDLVDAFEIEAAIQICDEVAWGRLQVLYKIRLRLLIDVSHKENQ